LAVTGELPVLRRQEETGMTELHEVMVPGAPGVRYEASWGRRPPRKSTTWWAGVVHELVDGGGMELWHCDHRHRGEQEALDCAVEWARAKAAAELAAYQPPPGASELRAAVERDLGMPVEFRDPYERWNDDDD
jgi:hypothetical protein